MRSRLEPELAAAIERTLSTEARKSELVVAYVRLIAVGVAALLDAAGHFFPAAMNLNAFSLANAFLATAWFAVSFGITVLLRRGRHRPSFRLILAAVDGAIILSLWLMIWSTTPRNGDWLREPLVTVAAACVLLAATGGLRLTRAAAGITSASAMVVFAVAASTARFGFVPAGFICGMILAAGFMAGRIADLVRRSMESEVGRAVLSRFLPAKVVEEAHRDPLSLISTPVSLDATIVVSDLRGFTAYAESLTPQEVFEFLNEIQGSLATVVRSHGGIVDKFMGDGMLAVFGAPEPLSDHARRGIEAAEAMLRAVEATNTRRRSRGSSAVEIGIGVHSGAVTAGCLGKGLRLEYTVLGDTVNTASRLEALTKERDVPVLVSEETVRRIGPHHEGSALRTLGPVAIRGRVEPLVVYAMGFEVVSAPAPPG